MAEYVVAVAVDKVQDFLYSMLQPGPKENQTNRYTLASILNSSRQISHRLYEDLGMEGAGAFHFAKEDILLQCSGKCIFTTTSSEEEIEQKLGELFQRYYTAFNGQLLLKYVYFPQTVSTDQERLAAIKESGRRLKSASCLNHIIAKQQEQLFRFHKVGRQDKSGKAIDEAAAKKFLQKDAFVKHIDGLFNEAKMQNDNCFRMAVIKADFDGMSELFGNIKSYEAYKAVSEVLSREICLDGLVRHADLVHEKNKGGPEKFRMFPLYIAGDDIFFAVAVHHIAEGIALCKSMLQTVNEGVGGYIDKPLTLSIGVEIAFNREPIRYYYERVEKLLEGAKGKKKELPGCNRICFNQLIFFDGAYEQIKKYRKNNSQKLFWQDFLHSLKIVQFAMERDFKVHHFLYGLLAKLTYTGKAEQERPACNALLYHFLPRYLNAGDEGLRKAELLLLAMLLRHVSEKRGNRTYRCFNRERQKELKQIVELLLLFSDPRFSVKNVNVKAIEEEFDVKRIRSGVFNRNLSYLYDQLLKEPGGTALRKVFVQEAFYEPDSKGKGNKVKAVKVYRTLRAGSAMFYRIKQLIGSLKLDKNAETLAGVNGKELDEKKKKEELLKKIAEMLAGVNEKDLGTVEEEEKSRKEEHKAPPHLYFDKEKFSEAAKDGALSEDYLDSLLIFYSLNEALIQYKTLYPANKENTKNKENKGGKQ